MFKTARSFLGLACVAFAATACQVTEQSKTVATKSVASYRTDYRGPKAAISIGKFNNASPYRRGIFSDGVDRLGSQARTILKTHLSQTGRFDLFDRENLKAMGQESGYSGAKTKIQGARYLVSGEVTEFGRKSVGDKQLFGVLGRGKTQVAYSKVSLNVIDARTSRVVSSVQGAGEFSLSSREILGTGSTSGYDSTLNGKVLNLAVMDAVNKLVAEIESRRWTPETKR